MQALFYILRPIDILYQGVVFFNNILISLSLFRIENEYIAAFHANNEIHKK